MHEQMHGLIEKKRRKQTWMNACKIKNKYDNKWTNERMKYN